jgi:hypothetical protein
VIVLQNKVECMLLLGNARYARKEGGDLKRVQRVSVSYY